MHIIKIWTTKKETQHTFPLHTSVKGWSFSPCWRWVFGMPILVWTSALAWYGGNLGLKLRLQVPNFSRTSGPGKSSSMSIMMSSTCISPLFSQPTPWRSPTRNNMGLRGDPIHLNEVLSPRPGLQNPSRLLTSWSVLLIRRIVPVGHSIHGGLPPICPRTRPPWHNLQNSKKSKHESSNMCINTLERLDPQITTYQDKLYIKQLMCRTWTKA